MQTAAKSTERSPRGRLIEQPPHGRPGAWGAPLLARAKKPTNLAMAVVPRPATFREALGEQGSNSRHSAPEPPLPAEVATGLTLLTAPQGTYTAYDRTAFFAELNQKHPQDLAEGPPAKRQAKSVYDLMVIRACNSRSLSTHPNCLGTALGLRMKGGKLTDTPCVIVYTAHKINNAWIEESQQYPREILGPGGLWCDLDVLELVEGVEEGKASCSGAELVDRLRGGDANIGPGSQIATEEFHGTMGPIVRSRKGRRALGFLTNRHVIVDLDRPLQRVYHPLPPDLGPSMYIGSVEQTVCYVHDYNWYGMFAGMKADTLVRLDSAFVRFPDNMDPAKLTLEMKGLKEGVGPVMAFDLSKPISEIVGKKVVKVGRTTGLTEGTILAFAIEHDDAKNVAMCTDLLIIGENEKPFDAAGDSGSVILMLNQSRGGWFPVAMLWGGMGGRGCLKLRRASGPQNWTSGVGLKRMLDVMEVDLVTSLEARTKGEMQSPCVGPASLQRLEASSGYVLGKESPERKRHWEQMEARHQCAD